MLVHGKSKVFKLTGAKVIWVLGSPAKHYICLAKLNHRDPFHQCGAHESLTGNRGYAPSERIITCDWEYSGSQFGVVCAWSTSRTRQT